MMKDEPIEKQDFERIEAEIASDKSPVGIDAKKTHVMILLALERLEKKLDRIERRVEGLEEQR